MAHAANPCSAGLHPRRRRGTGNRDPGDQVRGPRLTDRDFFAALDLTRPALGQVAAAVAGGDLARAKADCWPTIVHRRIRRGTGTGIRSDATKNPRWRHDQLERFCATLTVD